MPIAAGTVSLARVALPAPPALIPLLNPPPGPRGSATAVAAAQPSLRGLAISAGGVLSPVSGLALGAAVHLLPLLVVLDVLALGGLVVVLRRTLGAGV